LQIKFKDGKMELTKENLEDYKKKDKELKELVLKLKFIKDKFDLANKELIDKTKSLKKSQDKLIEGFKKEAMRLHEKTNETTLLGGLKVLLSKEPTLIYDKDKALMWAKEHDLALKLDLAAFEAHDKALIWAKEHDIALTLDVAAFELYAKAEDFDFVTKETKKRITFPSKIVFED